MTQSGLDGTIQNSTASKENPSDRTEPENRLVFGDWIFAPRTGELWRGGSGQPAMLLRPQLKSLLELLSMRPGQLISRSEIHRALWGETVVDLDRGLNFCVRQLREVLGDDARRPRYIETLPRQGYRFIAEVAVEQVTEVLPGAPAAGAKGSELSGADQDEPAATIDRQHRGVSHPEGATETPTDGKGVGFVGPGRFLRLGATVLAVLAVLVGLMMAVAHHRGAPSDSEMVAPADPDFREALETGRLLMRRGLGSMDRAERALTRAVTLNPDSAEAWAELAKAQLFLAEKDADGYESAWAAAQRSLELDPQLPLAHVRLGEVLSLRDFDWSAAEATFRHALKLDPNHVEALHRLAFTLSMVGRDEEALGIMEEARNLDPMSTLLVGDAVVLHLYAERYVEAEKLSRKLIELNPQVKSLHVLRVFVLEKLEKWPEAGAAARELAKLDGREWQGHPTDAEGLKDFWRYRLQELGSETGSPARLARAGIHAHLGNPSAALDELEAVAASRSLFLAFELRDPRFEILHGDPRFLALVDQVGLSGVPWVI